MEHDNLILPTIPPAEVGSNRSYTSISESESCITVRIKMRNNMEKGGKRHILPKETKDSWFSNQQINQEEAWSC